MLIWGRHKEIAADFGQTQNKTHWWTTDFWIVISENWSMGYWM